MGRGPEHAALFDAAAEEVVLRGGDFNAQGVCNTMWACCVGGHYGALHRILTTLGSSDNTVLRGSKRLPVEARGQLLQVQAAANVENAEVARHLQSLLEQTPFGAGDLSSRGTLPRPPSRLHIDISQHLESVTEDSSQMGVHETRHVLGEGIVCDLAWPTPKVAVEVQGPDRFSIDTRELDGGSKLKVRLLEVLGWQVLYIPHWEWDSLGASSTLKAAYLRSVGVVI